MRQLDLAGLRRACLDAIFDGLSIKEMFMKAHECIGLDLQYFDTQFVLVANASSTGFKHPAWAGINVRGYASEEEIVSGDYLSYQQRMYATGKSQIFDYGNCEGYPQACGPVIVDGVLVGYMGTMICDAVPEQVIEANDIICDAIVIITRKFLRTDDGARIERLVKTGDPVGLREEKFRSQYPPPYYYIVITAGDAAVATLEYAKRILCGSGSGFIGCLNGECELRVLSYTRPGEPPGPRAEQLEQFSRQHRLACGVSDSFDSILNLRSHIQQALLALSVGAGKYPGRQVYSFKELYRDIVVSGVLERGGCRVHMSKRVLSALDDREAGTDHFRTLRAYFENAMRAAPTAESLGVHKNTVLSRLSRFRAATGLDPNDPGTALMLRLQLELYRACRGIDESGGV